MFVEYVIQIKEGKYLISTDRSVMCYVCKKPTQRLRLNQFGVQNGGGQILFSHGTSQARGAMILFKKDFQVKIIQHQTDEHGRVVTCLIETQDKQMCITNIYAPNTDSPSFFEQWFRRSFETCDQMVVIGDFNTVLNPALDRSEKTGANNERAAQKIRELMQELKLEDVWRIQNENTRRYSWYRKKTEADC